MSLSLESRFAPAELALLDAVGIKGDIRAALLQLCVIRNMTIPDVLGKGAVHLLNGLAEPEFVGIEASARLKKLLRNGHDSLH